MFSRFRDRFFRVKREVENLFTDVCKMGNTRQRGTETGGPADRIYFLLKEGRLRIIFDCWKERIRFHTT
jgi:hypothetical protein